MAQMQTRETRLARLETWLTSPDTLAKIAAIAPKHQRADRIARLAWFQITTNPKLAECTHRSIAECILTCAQLGLEPNSVSQHAHFIPFKNHDSGEVICTLVPGYKGLIDLAMRTGRIVTFEPRVVRLGDEFEYRTEPPTLVHREAEDDEDLDPAHIRYFYAVVVHNDAHHYRQSRVMTRKQVDAVRARSRAKDAGPWVTDYEAMGLKTVVIRLCKYLPSSVELASIVTLDDQASSGKPQTLAQVDTSLLDGLDEDTSGPHVDVPNTPGPSSVRTEAAAEHTPRPS